MMLLLRLIHISFCKIETRKKIFLKAAGAEKKGFLPFFKTMKFPGEHNLLPKRKAYNNIPNPTYCNTL